MIKKLITNKGFIIGVIIGIVMSLVLYYNYGHNLSDSYIVYSVIAIMWIPIFVGLAISYPFFLFIFSFCENCDSFAPLIVIVGVILGILIYGFIGYFINSRLKNKKK